MWASMAGFVAINNGLRPRRKPCVLVSRELIRTHVTIGGCRSSLGRRTAKETVNDTSHQSCRPEPGDRGYARRRWMGPNKARAEASGARQDESLADQRLHLL